jgi:hypothetical protein
MSERGITTIVGKVLTGARLGERMRNGKSRPVLTQVILLEDGSKATLQLNDADELAIDRNVAVRGYVKSRDWISAFSKGSSMYMEAILSVEDAEIDESVFALQRANEAPPVFLGNAVPSLD